MVWWVAGWTRLEYNHLSPPTEVGAWAELGKIKRRLLSLKLFRYDVKVEMLCFKVKLLTERKERLYQPLVISQSFEN